MRFPERILILLSAIGIATIAGAIYRELSYDPGYGYSKGSFHIVVAIITSSPLWLFSISQFKDPKSFALLFVRLVITTLLGLFAIFSSKIIISGGLELANRISTDFTGAAVLFLTPIIIMTALYEFYLLALSVLAVIAELALVSGKK